MISNKEKIIKRVASKNLMLQKGDAFFSKLEVIPTGSLSLDLALGIGGYPRGCVIDIFGEPYSGKSLLSLLAIREVQKKEGIAVVVDAERAYTKSKKWMIANGVDISKLYFIREPIGEKALDLVYDLVIKNAVDLIVVDSVPALVPNATMNRELNDGAKIGASALMITQALQKLTPAVDDSKVVCMFINQLRAKIDTQSFARHYDDAEKSTGGNALRFYASVRIGVKKIGGSYIKEGPDRIGHRIKIFVYKNKVATPYKSAEFDIYYERGVNPISEIPRVARKLRIVQLKGRTFSFNDKKWIGKKKYIEAVKTDKELAETLLKSIRKKLHEECI